MLSLRSMLDDLIEKFSAKADKPVHFSLALEAETVVADGEFLKEAISNLIDNAIKYSGASVAIIISSFCKPDGAVVIKVKYSKSMSVHRLQNAVGKAEHLVSDWD